MKKILIFVAALALLVGGAVAVPNVESTDNPAMLEVSGVDDGTAIRIQMDGSFQTDAFMFSPQVGFTDCKLFYDFSCLRNGTFSLTADATELKVYQTWVRYPGDRVSTGDDPVDIVTFDLQPGVIYTAVLSGEMYDEQDTGVFLTFDAVLQDCPDEFVIEVPPFIGEVDMYLDGNPVMFTVYTADSWNTHTFTVEKIMSVLQHKSRLSRPVVARISRYDLGRYSRLPR